MVSMSLFYHMILSKKPATFWDHALERLPTRWTHLIDKESLRFKELEHVGNMLWSMPVDRWRQAPPILPF
jgi:hypothetical protein